MNELLEALTLPLPGMPGIAHMSLARADELGLADFAGLPRSLLVLAEGILRAPGSPDQIRGRLAALKPGEHSAALLFQPGRALLQDFMGIPLMTDLASMRDALAALGADPLLVQPRIPVDFVVDHSLVAAYAGRSDALVLNRQFEMERNAERFAFIKWCQQNFNGLRVIPPGRGIMHQVNLEWLASVVRIVDRPSTPPLAVPDTMIGTDSHTTMVNALGVLGWGVGGLEAEAAILGIPSEMARPKVVGVRVEGRLAPGVTATDMVLHLTQMLRRLDVVGAFVEFHGPGVSALPVADRATIANMAPEFGATCAYFPIDAGTLGYLALTGRDNRHIELVEAYARAQGLWQDSGGGSTPAFDENHVFDLDAVEPSLAGPVRPQDRVSLPNVPASFDKRMTEIGAVASKEPHGTLDHGAVVIAAITSCTNTSNPAVMLAAGLLARNAVGRGLRAKPWVKTSLSPGSRIVTDYLDEAGLSPALDALGFHNIGYGCATCNGNSGALPSAIAEEVRSRDLCVAAVLSGNRNFEGRIHPQVKAAYLASPPLVVAYAIAGSMHVDLTSEPLGTDPDGKPVMLADIWPSEEEIAEAVHRYVRVDLFHGAYDSKIESTEAWETLATPPGPRFPWDPESSFIGPSPFVAGGGGPGRGRSLSGLRPLLVLGHSITTDHISPNGAIRPDSPAGRYLTAHGVEPGKLGNYGARRGNPTVCLRGMFDNRLLENHLVHGQRGNKTRVAGETELLSAFDAAERHRAQGNGCVIVAGSNYGAGSSRDWAAKGVALLGVRAVLAESFERIHASNLIGMGILPLLLPEGLQASSLNVEAEDSFDLDVDLCSLAADMPVPVTLRKRDTAQHFTARLLARTESDLTFLRGGGLLPTLLDTLSQ